MLDKIHKELTEIFQDIFDDDELQLTDDVSAQDIDDWDSLNHINLIVAIERQFNVTLPIAEINRLKNIGDMKKLLQEKISGQGG